MSKSFSCGNTHTDVGEVRGCSGCQANGTAARVHAGLKDSDPVESMPGIGSAIPAAEASQPTPAPAKAKRRVKAKAKPKAKAKAKAKSKKRR